MGKKKVLLVGFSEILAKYTGIAQDNRIDCAVLPSDTLPNLADINHDGDVDIAIVYAGIPDLHSSKKISTINKDYQALIDSLAQVASRIVLCTIPVDTTHPKYSAAICQKICLFDDNIRTIAGDNMTVVDIQKRLSIGESLPWYKQDEPHLRHEMVRGDHNAVIGNLIRVEMLKILWE